MIDHHQHTALQKLIPVAEAYQAARKPQSLRWLEARHAVSYGYEALNQFVHRDSALLAAAKSLTAAMIAAGIQGKIPEKTWDAMQDAIEIELVLRRTLKEG